MIRQKPPIIIGEELLKIFDNGIEKLNQILNNLEKYKEMGGISGAALFAYSIFEGTLFTIYSKVLKAFPEKARLAYNNVDTKLLFRTSRTSVVIEELCENFSRNFGHDKFKSYINTFNEIVGIDIHSITFPVKTLDEFKEDRNCIAHRGNIISLERTQVYIEAVRESLSLIREKFSLKYKKYTDTELIKKSCAYIFNMFEWEFNECFVFSKGHVGINRIPLEAVYDRLSSSETHCFLLFIANYNAGISEKFKIKDLMPRVSLTNDTIDRISFINDLFEAYPHLINR